MTEYSSSSILQIAKYTLEEELFSFLRLVVFDRVLEIKLEVVAFNEINQYLLSNGIILTEIIS